MFNNQPNNPADFFTYIDSGDGAPVWVYVDTDIMEVPDGTLGLSFTLENSVEDRTTDDIWCFEEAIDVAQWHNYFRRPEWPKNVFRSLQDETFEVRRSPGPGGPDDPPVELLDNDAELYYYKCDFDYTDEEVTDLSIWPRNPHTAFPNFCVPHLRGPRTFVIQETEWQRPASLSRAIDAIENGSSSLPMWVFCSDGECDFVSRRTGVAVIRLGHDEDTCSQDFGHVEVPAVEGAYSIPYYRQSGWPGGLFRIVDSYRFEGDSVQVPAHIMGISGGRARDLVPPARIDLDYIRDTDLIHAFDVNTQLVAAAALLPTTQEWWFWDENQYESRGDGTVHFARSDGDSYSYHEFQPGFTNRAGTQALIVADDHISHSLYRFERWPVNTFCNAWDAEGEPIYGPNSFGTGYDEDAAGEEDETSFENPIMDPDAFAFQKWVKFSAWHPTATNHQRGRTVWVGGDTIGSESFYPVNGNGSHPFESWTNEFRQHESCYYRRRHFPEGVYRRLDRMRLQGPGGCAIARIACEDEPPLSECGAPWHSSYLKDWVEKMQEEIGRPIFSNPREGSPWLRLWSPEGSEDADESYTAAFGDDHITLQPGAAQEHEIGFDQEVLDRLCCDDGAFFAMKYRLGIDLMFDPCSVRYVAGTAASEGAPEEAIEHYLSRIEGFFRDYKDPDIVGDLADSLYARVAAKKDSFAGELRNKNHQIERKQAELRTLVAGVAQVYENMAYYDTMSLGKYKAVLEANRELITHHGTLKHRGNQLTLTLDVFEIQGQQLGPMMIKLDMGNRFDVTVHAVRGCTNKSQHGHVHPHVHNSSEGTICWGQGGPMAAALTGGIDPLEFLFMTAVFLKTSYQPGDAYCRIGQWRRVETWHCEPCRDDHPQGSTCPQTCQSCSVRVHWDDHGRCERHNVCWEYADRETCPVCDGEQVSAQLQEGQTSAAE